MPLSASPERRRAAGQQRAALELLGRLRPHWRRDLNLPKRIESLLAKDRRFGSRDRRLYRELIYAALRALPWIEPYLDSSPDLAVRRLAWLASDNPATRDFRAALAGDWPPCPPGFKERGEWLGADPLALLPDWLRLECPQAFEPGQVQALLSRAPVWLRLRSAADAPALKELEARGWACQRSELLPSAVRLEPGAPVEATEGYRRGAFEIQDLSSQLVLESVGIGPGGRWLDACAGAGGKSLQLACLLGPAGRVDACDIRPAALAELSRRATRAGMAARIGRPAAPRGPYDGVLLDVPCSGSGTWRRAPHLKWVTDPAGIAAHARRQRELLDRHASLVVAGGRLVYATCSLCRSENEDNVSWFLAGHPEFEGAGLAFLPAAHDGDGFFVASLKRK